MASLLASPSQGNYDFLLRRPSAILEAQYEDAILSIGSAVTAVEFREAVDSALHLALLNVKHSLILLLDVETNELAYFCSDTETTPMPKSGILWEVVRRRNMEIVKTQIPDDDPVRSLLPAFKSLEQDQVVVLSPIVDKKEHRVFALIMAVCEELSVIHQERLRLLERNVLVAASRVLKHMKTERERGRAESMLRVCGDLSDLDTATLTVKILKHLRSTLDAEMCVLFTVDDATSELVCQVFDEMPLDKEIRKSLHECIYGRCYLSGEDINIPDVSKDVRFNPEVDVVSGYEPAAILAMPVRVTRKEGGKDSKPIAVAVAYDKKRSKVFTSRDENNMLYVLRFCATVLSNTLAYQREKVLKKQNEALLQVACNLFNKLGNHNVLLLQVMNEARSLVNAERCSLFLLNHQKQELVAEVFDSDLPKDRAPLRIPVGQGIAGFVAKTGKPVNIRDAYKHPKFFKEVDQNTGFRTRNMLCFPITTANNVVVGVAQLVNKVGGKFFTSYDEELAMTFAVYCGISIYHSQLYSKMVDSRKRSTLATELMLYHMKVKTEDVEEIMRTEVPGCRTFHPKITEFTYSPMSIPDSDTILAVISMAKEMGLIERWQLQTDSLARFVLMVKSGYRDPPYHNWFHAFSVVHFAFALHQNCDRLSFLTDMEVLALFFSCLCHDIDHRGTNNAFQVSSNSLLASLYHTAGSVMERHHFAQTMCILDSEGCNIFESLSPDDYRKVLDLVRHNILATDIAEHLRQMKAIQQMAKDGYTPSNPAHHQLLSSLLMTSCDLCGNCKVWESSKEISELVYQEFFTQGDLEKALGFTPSNMMDRERAFVPELQLGFLNGIAEPVYKVLSELLPPTAVVYESLKTNRAKWEGLKQAGQEADAK